MWRLGIREEKQKEKLNNKDRVNIQISQNVKKKMKYKTLKSQENRFYFLTRFIVKKLYVSIFMSCYCYRKRRMTYYSVNVIA